MEVADRVEAEFTLVNKRPMYPSEVEDLATVDFDAGLHQVVILGYVNNEGGDSRHELRLDEVRIDEDEPVGLDSLTVTLRVHKRDSAEVLTGRTYFPYRLHLEIEPPLPQRYVITHVNEHDQKRFEVNELFMSDLDQYQREKFEK